MLPGKSQIYKVKYVKLVSWVSHNKESRVSIRMGMKLIVIGALKLNLFISLSSNVKYMLLTYYLTETFG